MRAPQIESITERELRANLFFLASDALQGRLTNTPENAIAADWVRSQFESFGLLGGGHGGGFEHRYSLMTASLGDGNALRVRLKGHRPTAQKTAVQRTTAQKTAVQTNRANVIG